MAEQLRVNSSGSILWAIQLGGAEEDQAYGVAADGSGGATITGRFYTVWDNNQYQPTFGSFSFSPREPPPI